ncbi:MAG: Mycosin-5 [Cellulomonadaceae bacterium TMED98]|nr:MAG: Mycosin-5 [Cellulomonadaceae bacterium TMED98]
MALVRSAYPSMDAANVINRILATATPVTGAVPDPLYGYGLIDAYAAVSADVPLVRDNPLGSIAEWVVVYRRGDSDEVLYPLGPIEPPQLDPPTRIGEIPQESAAGPTDMIPLYMVAGLSAAMVLIVSVGAVTVFRVSRKPLD